MDLPDPPRDEDGPQWTKLYDHFLSLVDDVPGLTWGIEQDYDDPDPRGAYAVSRDGACIVLSHSPETPWPYLLALHEIGHVVFCDLEEIILKPDLEALAWRWALEHSLFKPTPDDRYQIRQALESYRCTRWESLVAELTDA